MDFTATIITALLGVGSFAGIIIGYQKSAKSDLNSLTDNILCMFLGLMLGLASMGVAILLFIFAPLILVGVAAAIVVVYKLMKASNVTKAAAEAESIARKNEANIRRYGRTF